MQPINMIKIYNWDNKHKKRLHVLEADIITIFKKYWFGVSSSKNVFFTSRIPNDRHCACLSIKSLSYWWVKSILRPGYVIMSLEIKETINLIELGIENLSALSHLFYVQSVFFFLSFFCERFDLWLL